MSIKNHIHFRHIMLYHYEKGLEAEQSFRDLNHLFERRVAKSIAKKGWELESPTEAPTDYHVNRSLKNWQTNKVIWIRMTWWPMSKRGVPLTAATSLPVKTSYCKWEAIIEVDGDYAPE